VKLRLAALLFLALPAFAQQFRILRVTPATGPAEGGTRVAIELDRLPNCPILPIGPSITFGGVAGEFLDYEDEDTLIVRTPAHAVGTVEVRIEMCGANGPIVAEDAFTFVVEGDDPAREYERVLLPVIFRGPGAFGAQWQTTIVAHNRSDHPIGFARPVFMGTPMCPAICGCGPRGDLQARETNEVCVEGLQHPAGVLVYPWKDRADSVSYSLRITDTSRTAESLGTEIPVVRERDFRIHDDKIVLPDVPFDDRYRVALRIYDADSRDGAELRLRIVSGTSTVLDTIVTLRHQPELSVGNYQARPAFLFIGDLAAAYPALEAVEGRVQIELSSRTLGLRFWAMASITNNETQQVTTATPQ
jgi:hypothetical protein